MKKYILIFLVAFFTGFIFTGCVDNEIFIPKDIQSVFHFTAATASVAEVTLDKNGEPVGKGNTLDFTVMWSKHAATSGNITLAVYPRTKVPAIEGTDYTISTKSLSFSEDQYTQTFSITTKYDPTYTGAKTFTIKISGSNVDDVRIGAFGASDSVRVTINDVNHPLVALIGDVKLKAERYPSSAPSEVNSVIAPDPDDNSVLWLTTNLSTNAFNTPLKMVVKDTGEGYEVSIKFPQKSANYSATQTAWWFATVWIDAEDDWDDTLDDHTIVGITGKDKIEIKFDGGFVQYVTNNDNGSVLGYTIPYIIPRTLVISK